MDQRPARSAAARPNPPALAGLLVAALSIVLAAGCESRAPEPARQPGPLRIVVTVAPLAGLVRPLAPPDAQVTVLMSPGRSEHSYEPTARNAEVLSRADLVVSIGLNLEPQVQDFLRDRPSSRRVEVRWGAALGLESPAPAPQAARDDDHDHEHADDHDHDHDHGPVDQHLWLDPVLVKKMVPILADAVRKAQSNAGQAATPPDTDGLLARIEQVDAAYRSRLAPLAGRALVTHHNAWGRLAERYGLKVAAVLRPVEQVEPTPGEIEACVRAVREAGVTTIFVEPQFNAEAARRVAKAAGVKVRVLDPLGDGDWFGLMERNLESLIEGLGGAE